MMHAKISVLLRTRPEWRTLGPALVASTSISFQEGDTTDCDLVIPLSGQQQPSTVHVLLLWTSDPMTSTEEQLRRFLSRAKRTTDQYVAMVTEDKEKPSMCAAHVLSSLQHRIVPTIERYIQELNKKYEIKIPPMPMPTTLVAHASTSAPAQPLSAHDANVLTDLCPSIRGLEEATRTNNGRERLAEYLGPVVTKTLVDFWEDEWII
ncbi:hypothetical protein AYO20_05492 [Fonsecaea nubica]|uniref:Uncharacterized protein n=1 Tax=Fonsecaea nubica TaxID=856822 RepID=A0A178CZG8_9EURO|nr:hypothetical protein AYO20_05492 [Fonsecaea nubica]OAL35238.1 hypothetical protein AYO20_05492 [Fonsecaea nubica]